MLTTAERLFYDEGFHATGIDRVVSEAGVVRMTLYNHFGSKDELVAAVLARRQERFLARLDAADAAAAPGAATLALVDAYGDWLAGHATRGCTFMKALGEYAEHNAAIRDQALAAKRELLRRIRAALAKDGIDTAGDLDTRIFLVLEGCYAGIVTLGAEAAVAAARRSVAELITPTATED
jgi:AcrR family transcriptional regulator